MNLLHFQTRFVLFSPSFITTQLIYDRLSPGFLTVKIRDRVDYWTVEQVYLSEHYCLRRLERYNELLFTYRGICAEGKTPLILDLGAHSGMASKYFSREFPQSKIIAVEPDAQNLEAARQNLQGHTNVTFIHAGISCESGKGRLEISDLGSWAHRTERDQAGVIEMVSVDSILQAENTSDYTPFLVKIDIEGFEKDLFMSNTEWIDRFPLLIIELHDRLFPGEGNSRNFLQCVAARNRDFVYLNENIFSIKNSDDRNVA